MSTTPPDADALVRSALAGDANDYTRACMLLVDDTSAEWDVCQLLAALTAHAEACMADARGGLVQAALRVRWPRSTAVAERFLLFCQEIVARRAVMVEPVLMALVAAFAMMPPVAPEVADATHAVVQSLLFTCPLAARVLCDLIHRHFPHRVQGAPAHANYLTHVLRVMAYEEYVRPILLPHVVQQLAAMDAEAAPPPAGVRGRRGSHGEDAGGFADERDDGVFHMEDMPPRGPEGGVEGRAVGGGAPAGGGAQLDPESHKLDELLALVFDFFHRLREAAPASPKSAEMLARGLLQAFDAFVLPAPAPPRYVHFCLFVGLGAGREHAAGFLGYLAKKFAPGRAGEEGAAVRLACASYAASFAASAAYLDAHSVLLALEALLQCAEGVGAALGAERRAREAGPDAGDARRQGHPGQGASHELYLAAAQGACVVASRRWAMVSASLRAAPAPGRPSVLDRLRAVVALDAANVLATSSAPVAAFVRTRLLASGHALEDGGAGPSAAPMASEPLRPGEGAGPGLPLPFDSYALPLSAPYVRALHASTAPSPAPSGVESPDVLSGRPRAPGPLRSGGSTPNDASAVRLGVYLGTPPVGPGGSPPFHHRATPPASRVANGSAAPEETIPIPRPGAGPGSEAMSNDCVDSFTNCWMSFSPDDLEAHIQRRFEECKRAADLDGFSPGSPNVGAGSLAARQVLMPNGFGPSAHGIMAPSGTASVREL